MRRNMLKAPASKRGKFFRNTRYNPSRTQSRGRGKYIDPATFVNKAIPAAEQTEFVPRHQFADFGLLPQLERTLAIRGFTTPTPVQDGAIPSVLEGRDVIGLANTGTGKTAAFVLPIIHRLKTELPRGTTALIIAPTRELALQIDTDFRAFAAGLGLYSALCLGGMNINPQKKALRRGPHVVIGTPGRLKDLYQQKALRLETTSVVVLDEADRMLDMGFIHDIRFLLDLLPTQRQSLCFSATIPPGISQLLDRMLQDPVTVSVRTRETSDHVEQDVIKADSKNHKIEILSEMLNRENFEKVLVFGETKWGVQRLAERLQKSGHRAEAIHGNKSQPQRQRALMAFREGKAKVLVATDVAARGLDIPDVSHVINFDQPNSRDDYVHRIGRTGRAGKRGHALTFIGPSA